MEDTSVKLICATENGGDILEGSLGFFKEEQLSLRYPDDTITKVKNTSFPKDYRFDHYKVKKIDGVDCLCRRDQSEIDAIPQRKSSLSVKAQALYDVDASRLTGVEKIVVEYLQGFLGK